MKKTSNMVLRIPSARIRQMTTPLLLSLMALIASGCQESPSVESGIIKAEVPPPTNIADPTGFKTLPGFAVELVHEVDRETQGSWVSLAEDDRGRLYASDQTGNLWRITPAPVGAPRTETRVEKVPLAIGFAQGLLYAHNALYVVANVPSKVIKQFAKGDTKVRADFAPPQSGLYRLRDTDDDDNFDTLEQLALLPGAGEHGPHSIVLAPDGKSLLLVAGNYTKIPEFMTQSRVPRVWGEDQLTPRLPDPRGHAVGVEAPGGWVAQTDPEAKEWTLIAVGLRNTYDIAVSPAGEIFGFDADMEWDIGSTWYRPTRLLHIVSGADFGWRHGSGKWPEYFEDSLPAMSNIGPGSPTGMLFGTGAAFPEKYQRALYAFDWTFGRIYVAHLEPQGASFRAAIEEFVSGQPLPLTDGVIAKDGALYFLTGGRNISSGLYRVVYRGTLSTQEAGYTETPNEQGNARRRLETLHHAIGKQAVDQAWPFLASDDDFLRHAARTVLEHQDPALWRDRVLRETTPRALIAGATAMARVDSEVSGSAALNALRGIDWSSLDNYQRLDLLRAAALLLIRAQDITDTSREALFNALRPYFPNKDSTLNRELARVLSDLDAAAMRAALLDRLDNSDEVEPEAFAGLDPALLESGTFSKYGERIKAFIDNPTQPQRMFYAYLLHAEPCNWQVAQYQRYYTWIKEAIEADGGASFDGYLRAMRRVALECTPEDMQKNALSSVLVEDDAVAQYLKDLPVPEGPGRAWTIDQLVELAEKDKGMRSFERGRDMYKAGMCLACHNIAGQGGAAGPDLNGAAGRFDREYLLRSILQPSDAISDQYASVDIQLKDGTSVTGRIMYEDDKTLRVAASPFDSEGVESFRKKTVVSRRESTISPMPPGLILGMNKDEILDLLAYIEASGNPDHPKYKKSAP